MSQPITQSASSVDLPWTSEINVGSKVLASFCLGRLIPSSPPMLMPWTRSSWFAIYGTSLTFRDELSCPKLHDADLDALTHVDHAHVEGCVRMLQHLHEDYERYPCTFAPPELNRERSHDFGTLLKLAAHQCLVAWLRNGMSNA